MCPKHKNKSTKPLNKNIPMSADGSMNDKEWFQVYWNYFSLMSSQRIQMMNFYITIEVVLVGGFFTLLNLEKRISWAEYITAIAITLISLTFWGLDYRSKQMIHQCEDLMEKMEKCYPQYTGMHLIRFINGKVNIQGKETNTSNQLKITYSKWFLLQFILIGFFGLFCLVLLKLGKL